MSTNASIEKALRNMSTDDIDIEKALRNLRECRSFSISRTVFISLAKAAVDLEMSRSRLLEVAARNWLTANGYLDPESD